MLFVRTIEKALSLSHQSLLLLMSMTTTINGECSSTTPERGFFWHITDMHYDPSYNMSGPLGVSCLERKGSSGSYGSYVCDSPWRLINSSVLAMKQLCPDVDFIIWTGDDTPHTPNIADVSLAEVADIIGNLTEQILLAFPNKTVFPVLGNHDWSPKSQLPPKNDSFYHTVADIWAQWLKTPTANEAFRRSGYYSMQLNENILLVGLNTNLYYESNKITTTMPDPGNQLQWLDETLTMAATSGSKVILIGHVPPGQFEKHQTKYWFYPHYNELFVALLRKHSGVFGSIHFGHHHTDTFRLFYDDKGVTTGSFFIAPAVTPWETTLSGVMGGAGNNPGVRLVEYFRKNGTVFNVLQYYLNLTKANLAAAAGNEVQWELAYNASEYYNEPDMTTSSLKKLVDKMWKDDSFFDKYYKVNGLYFDPNEKWTPDYKVVHCCSIEQLGYQNYSTCVRTNTPSQTTVFTSEASNIIHQMSLLQPTIQTLSLAAIFAYRYIFKIQ